MTRARHGYPCPTCGAPGNTIDTRTRRQPGGAAYIHRRRICSACGLRWTTHERSTTSWQRWERVFNQLARISVLLEDLDPEDSP